MTPDIAELKSNYIELMAEQGEQRAMIENLQGRIGELDRDLIQLNAEMVDREHRADQAFDVVSIKEARSGLMRLQAEIDAVSQLRGNLDRELKQARTAEIAATTKLGTIRRRIWQSRLGELLAEFGERNADLLARIFIAGQRGSPGLIAFDLRKALYDAAALDRHPSADMQAKAASALREPDLDF